MSVFGQDLKSRFAVLGGIVVLVLAVLFVRLWSMQIIAGQSFALQSQNNRVRSVSIPAPRGRILDAKGRVLATNRPSLAVAVAPSVAQDAAADETTRPSNAQRLRATEGRAILSRLSTLLGMPVSDIEKKIANTKLEAVQPRVVALDVRPQAIAYISEHTDKFRGVEVQQVPIREYPNKEVAAHVLGYVGEISDEEMNQAGMKSYAAGDIIGKAGIERQYENTLQGSKGYQQLEVDAQGRVRRVIGRQEPVPGRDIRLTLDIDVQRTAEKALQNAFAEARRQGFGKANAGALVVMDVRTGGVVALASAPTYDPNKFVNGISAKDWKSLNATSSAYPLTDRAIMSTYPPASTFKVITGLAALQHGFASASTTFDCKGTWWFPGHENSNASWWMKHCWDAAGHGVINFIGGIEQSCDVVFYTLGYKFYTLPGEKLQAFARGAGYGRKAGIDLPGEVAGRVPDAAWKRSLNGTIAPEYAPWVPGDTVNMAIGQGDLLVTPLQMTDLFSAVANGGRLLQPHLLSDIMADGGKKAAWRANTVVTGKLPASADNLSVMQSGLRGVISVGTGKSAFAGFGEQVAGKTGTAQVGSPNLPKNSPLKKDDYAWFACYAPADAPRYAVAVVIEQGGHGGSVAAPAARDVLAQLAGLPLVHVSASDQSR
jgi:penicillin-binding protein 2